MLNLDVKTKKLLLFLTGLISFSALIALNIQILLPFIISFVFVYLLIPIVDYFERLKINRSISSSIITTLIVIFFIHFFFFFLPKFVYSKLMSINFSEVSKSISENTSLLLKKLTLSEEIIKNIQSKLFEISLSILQFANRFIVSHLKLFFKTAASLISFLVCPLIIFFSLRDWKKGKKMVAEIIPYSYRKSLSSFAKELDYYISKCLRGQLQVCLILGVMFSVGFYTIGLKSSLLIGMCLGLMSFVPFAGPVLGFFLIVSISFSQNNDVIFVLKSVSIVFTGQIIEGNFITPKIVGDKIGLHPVMIIFGLFISMSLFGLFGIIFALPITVFFKCLFVYFYHIYKKSNYYL